MPKSKHRKKNNTRVKPKPIKWKSNTELFQVPAQPRPTVELPRPASNSKMEFTFVPGFNKNNPNSKIPRPKEGGKSFYNIKYFLSIPGVDVFKDKVDFERMNNSGNSLLQLPKNKIGKTLTTKVKDIFGESEIHFVTNRKGVVSQVHLRIESSSFEEAERFSHERVAMVLSYWSFLFDTAIEMSEYLLIEENTGVRKYSVGLVGKVKMFNNDSAFNLPAEHQRILAAYREAMNTSNLFYKLLCFFKVTEGIISLRIKAIKKQRPLKKGEQGFTSSEVFPESLDLIPVEDEFSQIAFEEFLGLPFQEVRDHFKDYFRNAISHLIKFDSVLDADRYDDVTKCARAIPIIKYIARTMLQNDLGKLANKP
jgi:hypothetical protein